ncbi:family 20 glycosylhydrolase [Acetobacter oeni]|nr:family 20 glycosylhydrolase [Acetobacter oeni]
MRQTRTHSMMRPSHRRRLATTALAALLFTGGAQAKADDVPPLLPLPASMTLAAGYLRIPATLPVTTDNVAPAHLDILVETLRSRSGPALVAAPASRATGTPATPTLHFRLLPADPSAPAESYDLTVTPTGVTITAHDQAGLYYGAGTLAQLLSSPTKTIPALRIRDQPRLRWRGMMVDSSRHFQTPDDIRTMIDAMGRLKLNVLHWHLTDDQGWRIEIRRYPELTRIGAWRHAPDSGPNGDGTPYGGFYTQDQIREIVAYAEARNITIVPELDMPGHAQAAIAAYPEIGSGGTPTQVSTVMGIHPYLYNTDDHTFAFIENVLTEVLELFPSRFIHLGGDEAVKEQWRSSPSVQARMRDLGVRDEEALQSWFIERLGTWLASHDRRLIGWDEILKGGLPPSASVMSWHGVRGAVAAAEAGHDAVMAPSSSLYFDYLQTNRDEEATGGRYPIESLATVYQFDPLPPGTTPQVQQHILGVEGALWTEYFTSGASVLHAAFPRASALAEIAWTPRPLQKWDSFLRRLPAEMRRESEHGVPVADGAFAVTLQATPSDTPSRITLTLSNQANTGLIRYTLDGAEPDQTAPLYRVPLQAPAGITLTAIPFDKTGHPLAAPTRRVITPDLADQRTGSSFVACPGGKLSVHVPATPDAIAPSPYLTIDRNRDCVAIPVTSLYGAKSLAVDLIPMSRFFGSPRDDPSDTRAATGPGSALPLNTLAIRTTDAPDAVIGSAPLPIGPLGKPLHLVVPITVQGTHALILDAPESPGRPYYGFESVTIIR